MTTPTPHPARERTAGVVLTDAMKRGRTEAETCALNGWMVGTVLRGYESWRGGTGVWTTIRITAIGERVILARCIRHEQMSPGGSLGEHACNDGEHMWTLQDRDWTVAALTDPTPDRAGVAGGGVGG